MKYKSLFILFLVLGSYSWSSQLLYSTFLGGNQEDSGYAIAVDSAGNVYITGNTDSLNFPVTTTAFNTSQSGLYNVFVSKLNPSSSGVLSLVYSTYLGGSNADYGLGIAIDAAGNACITGYTASPNFPVTSNAFSTTLQGAQNAFICKLNPSLSGVSSLVYSTYFGGSNGDAGNAIALDNAGNIYITGYTTSTDFPVTSNGYDTTLQGNENVFVSKLNPTLSGISALLYSTYLRGRLGSGNGIAVDTAGNAYITGSTLAADFPVTANGFSTTLQGVQNAFMCKLNPALSGVPSLVYSTYLGGNNADVGNAIALDNAGNAYITGYATSTDFPVTKNAFQTIKKNNTGDESVFVSKLNPSLSGISSLVYSSYLGGSEVNGDQGNGIAIDNSGNAYITGYAYSKDFPVTSNAFSTTNRAYENNGYTVFVSKLNSTLSGVSSLVYSTYLGGNIHESGQGIAVSSTGNTYIVGFTASVDFPVTTNAFQTTLNSSYYNVFVTVLSIPSTVSIDDWELYSGLPNQEGIPGRKIALPQF